MPPPEIFTSKEKDVRGPNKRRKYSSRFQVEWLEITKYKKWLRHVDEDLTAAECTVCQSRFDVSNMRVTSIESHHMGQKHKKRISAIKSPCFFHLWSIFFPPQASSNYIKPILWQCEFGDYKLIFISAEIFKMKCCMITE